MNGRKKKILITITIILSILLIVPVSTIAMLYTSSSFKLARPIKIAWSSVLLDSKENFLPCDELPSIAEVEKVFINNESVLRSTIDDPQAVTVESDSATSLGQDQWECEGKADILFIVGGLSERKRIENQFGDSIFGIPYRIVDV